MFTTDTYDEGSIFKKSCINSMIFELKLLPAYWISITEGENIHSKNTLGARKQDLSYWGHGWETYHLVHGIQSL